MADKEKVYIVDAKRTPFGKFGGQLAGFTPVELAVFSTQALLDQLNFKPELIDQVIFANVIPSTPDTLYAGRHLALKCGLPLTTPGIVINRLCGSGIQAILDASRLIKLGEASSVLVAGSECLSMAPHILYGGRFGTKYGGFKTQDLLLETLTDQYVQTPMGLTAEQLADDYKISKEESDQYAYHSHLKASKAYAEGLIQPEIISIKKDKINCDRDEHLRTDVSIEEMNKLRPTFKKDGRVTAGSASGIVDGAASMLVASEKFIRAHGLTPLAEIIDGHVIGVDPKVMGIGPVPAIQKLLDKQNKKLEEIDLFEINEAFAPQVMACQKELNIPPEKLNIWGGAIALGHPLGATGIKISLTLCRQMKHLKKEWGIASACIGGGQGISLLLKNYDS
jgi:acetyl-CoA acyltransferase 2